MTTLQHHSIPPTLPVPNCFTVLIVDDLLPNRLLLSKLLKNAGYAVIEAENGAVALELLNELPQIPDLIVTDIEMPVLDGISFIERTKRIEGKASQIPIIAASGNADDQMGRDASVAGADVFLTKPFNIAELRTSIAKLLREKRMSPADRLITEESSRANRLDTTLRYLKHG